jgi:uroporphyrinogen-III synthase
MNMSLAELRVLVTRSPEQAADLTRKLQSRGAAVTELPVLSIRPPENWDDLDACLDRIASYDWIIFASANAVRYLTSRMVERGLPPRSLGKCKIAAIGTATLESLEQHSLIAAFCPSRFVAESLIDEFPGYPNLSKQKFLWPRTDIGRDFIADRLTAAGAEVDSVVVYRTCEPEDMDGAGQQLQQLLRGNEIDVVTLASAQSARNLALLQRHGSNEPLAFPPAVVIASIGPETSKAAIEHLGRCDLEADPHTMDGLVAAIERWTTTRSGSQAPQIK